MRRRRLAGVLLAGVLLPAAAAADEPLNGSAIGSPLTALVRTLGGPAAVASEDSGHRFEFADGTIAYADDDGRVLAVATRHGRATLAVDGVARSFEIGRYSAARAEVELAGVAEYATAALRTYRLAPRRDLVLAFEPASQRLAAVTYGEPGQLARLGLLPGDAAAKAVDYHAPRLRAGLSPSVADAGLTTVYRLAVDRAGSVTSVEVELPSGSPGDDGATAARLQAERFAPAVLDGRPIAATVFIEVRH